MIEKQKPPELFCDRDVLADFLVTKTPPSLLRRLLPEVKLYTSVTIAGELFAAATIEEMKTVEHALWLVRVLGMHQRYAFAMAELWRESPKARMRDVAAAAVAKTSKLPVITFSPERFRQFSSIICIDGREVEKRMNDGESIKTVLEN